MLVRLESNSRPPAWQPDAQPTEPSVRCWSDPSKNIKLHKFPKKHETKRRRLWINFVPVKRAKWTFTPTSHLCSEHFRPEDFESQFSAVPGTSFVGRWSLENAAFFLIEPSERHTATDLVNFVYLLSSIFPLIKHTLTAHRWLSWLSIRLSHGRSWVRLRPDQHSGS